MQKWDAQAYGFQLAESEFHQTWDSTPDGRPGKTLSAEDGMFPRVLRLHPGTYQRLLRLSKEAERDGAYRVDHIQPTARKLDITKKISWHTFRHTFSSVLKANGEDVKVVQELP